MSLDKTRQALMQSLALTGDEYPHDLWDAALAELALAEQVIQAARVVSPVAFKHWTEAQSAALEEALAALDANKPAAPESDQPPPTALTAGRPEAPTSGATGAADTRQVMTTALASLFISACDYPDGTCDIECSGEDGKPQGNCQRLKAIEALRAARGGDKR